MNELLYAEIDKEINAWAEANVVEWKRGDGGFKRFNKRFNDEKERECVGELENRNTIGVDE